MSDLRDLLALAWNAVRSHRLRSLLSMLGIAIGIAAVILLTSIGEGTRRYILGMFTQFGTNLLGIHPGKTETIGVPGVLGGTTRKLTIDDAEAVARLPGVTAVVPVTIGTARVEAGGRGRSVYVYGVTPDVPEVWQFRARLGSFWPERDPRRGAQAVVLGATVKREIFGDHNPLGRFVRVGGARFRVVGVMEAKGRFLGIDLDDSAWIPVATAMNLFNLTELNEIDVLYANVHQTDQVVAAVRRLLTDRHGGKEDFTIVTQQAMLEVFGNVMDVITMSVGAIAGISLLVGAIGILTMMWITVNESTAEIGLLRALGARRSQVLGLFLLQAGLLATAGGAIGVAAGIGLGQALRLAFPGLPVSTLPEYVLAALALSFTVGLLSGALPARRAARLDPVEALRAE
jgi:putative ABC transport system permease protein